MDPARTTNAAKVRRYLGKHPAAEASTLRGHKKLCLARVLTCLSAGNHATCPPEPASCARPDVVHAGPPPETKDKGLKNKRGSVEGIRVWGIGDGLSLHRECDVPPVASNGAARNFRCFSGALSVNLVI
eukprot:scaffold57031_cov32-Tisochrysis_lutea.AAC.2